MDQPTPDRILQYMFAHALPLTLEAAVKHRVFDALAERPLTLDELAAATNTAPRGLGAIANLLVGLALLARGDDGTYRLTAESDAFLVSHRPSYLGAIFGHVSSHLLPGWLHLTEAVATGRPAARVDDESHGADFFSSFVEALLPLSYPATQVLAAELALAARPGPVSVLDVAAGSGVWSLGLAQSAPQVTIRAVDWPPVLPVTQRTAARFGLEGRVTLVGGDLMEADFGTGHQVATLGHILHSEGEPRSRALLRRCFDALAPGGTIAIAEFLVDADRRGPMNGLVFAVNMLVNSAQGGTYSFEEISSWLAEAGFVDARRLPAPGPSPLILADKPTP